MSNAFQMRIKEAVALEVASPDCTCIRRELTYQCLSLTYEPSRLGKCKQDHEDWQKVRLMPALLRIFTRVNLLAFIGEEQGMDLSITLPWDRTKIRLCAAANRLEVYDDVMSFFWSCAKAFPIFNLIPGFLLP